MTNISMQNNLFAELPEQLLWNMTGLLGFEAAGSTNLETLPEAFFKGQQQLRRISFLSSTNLGAHDRLPEGLFKGLVELVELDLASTRFKIMPNLDDLKVRCRSVLCVVPHLHRHQFFYN